jgi:hypothetical protein
VALAAEASERTAIADETNTQARFAPILLAIAAPLLKVYRRVGIAGLAD